MTIKNTIHDAEIFYKKSFIAISSIPFRSRFSVIVARRVYKKIGDYIKLKREAAGLTQTELADKLYDGQMEPKGLWKIENGLYTPNMYIIAEIAKVLNVSLSDFLSDFNH